jgi:hypothetical protein
VLRFLPAADRHAQAILLTEDAVAARVTELAAAGLISRGAGAAGRRYRAEQREDGAQRRPGLKSTWTTSTPRSGCPPGRRQLR